MCKPVSILHDVDLRSFLYIGHYGPDVGMLVWRYLDPKSVVSVLFFVDIFNECSFPIILLSFEFEHLFSTDVDGVSLLFIVYSDYERGASINEVEFYLCRHSMDVKQRRIPCVSNLFCMTAFDSPSVFVYGAWWGHLYFYSQSLAQISCLLRAYCCFWCTCMNDRVQIFVRAVKCPFCPPRIEKTLFLSASSLG